MSRCRRVGKCTCMFVCFVSFGIEFICPLQPRLITTLIIKRVGSATLLSVLSTFDNKAGKWKDNLSFIIFSWSLSDLISDIVYNTILSKSKVLTVSSCLRGDICQLISLGDQLRKSLVQHKICLFQKKYIFLSGLFPHPAKFDRYLRKNSLDWKSQVTVGTTFETLGSLPKEWLPTLATCRSYAQNIDKYMLFNYIMFQIYCWLKIAHCCRFMRSYEHDPWLLLHDLFVQNFSMQAWNHFNPFFPEWAFCSFLQPCKLLLFGHYLGSKQDHQWCSSPFGKFRQIILG